MRCMICINASMCHWREGKKPMRDSVLGLFFKWLVGWHHKNMSGIPNIFKGWGGPLLLLPHLPPPASCLPSPSTSSPLYPPLGTPIAGGVGGRGEFVHQQKVWKTAGWGGVRLVASRVSTGGVEDDRWAGRGEFDWQKRGGGGSLTGSRGWGWPGWIWPPEGG